MIPIRELLSRIRRDKKVGRGEFIIGYYDRVEDAIIRLLLREILVRPDDHFAFDIIDQEGGSLVIGAHEQLPDCMAGFEPWDGCRGIYRKTG